MTTNTALRKVVPDAERAVALIAIATAKSKHKHVGIRPKKERPADKRTSGILVPPGSHAGIGLDEAIGNAGDTWPDDNSWDIFGSDDFGSFPDDGSWDDGSCDNTLGDGYFEDPYIYGEFSTFDDPGWLGGYPA